MFLRWHYGDTQHIRDGTFTSVAGVVEDFHFARFGVADGQDAAPAAVEVHCLFAAELDEDVGEVSEAPAGCFAGPAAIGDDENEPPTLIGDADRGPRVR